MAANFLIDTGAILAILDENDRWHSLCAAAFSGMRLPGLTSEAVLTETFHLLRRSRTDFQNAWKFLTSGAVRLASIAEEELPAIRDLMFRYRDRPMDFADATLVHLAAREDISAVLTVDQGDFATYRLGGKRRFHVFPIERP